jgi:multidrug resistance protein, MATE family
MSALSSDSAPPSAHAPRARTRAAAEAMPILRLSLPIVAGLAASTMIGVVDTVMIAPLGTVPLAAASLTTAVIIIFYSALYGFLSATGVEAAHRHGAGDEDGVARALQAGLKLALGAGILGAAAMAGVFLLLPAIGQPPEVLAILGPYWLAMSGLLVPVAFLMAISQVLNAIDRPWTAAGFAFVGVILNVPLNFVLIWGVGGWEGLGLLGAGLASVASDGIALGIALLWLARSGLLVRRAPAPGLTRRLARDGLPLGIGYTGEGAAYAVVGLMLGLFGAVALAANQIVQAVGGVLYMLPLGMSAAVAIRVGQAIGAAERDRLRPVATAAIGLVTGWMAIVTVALVLFGGTVAAALSDDPDVVALATSMFVIVALIQVADGIQSTALGALRGFMDFRWPTMFTLACYWLLALPFAAALGFGAGLGPLGVWAGYGTGIVIAAVVLPLRFWRLTR